MLYPSEAENLLDKHALLTLDRAKEKYSAIYKTGTGHYVALVRRAKTLTTLYFEPKLSTGAMRLSDATVVEHLSPSTPRVHLPVPVFCGPYRGRPGYAAVRVQPASASDLALLIDAYAAHSKDGSRAALVVEPPPRLAPSLQSDDDESAYPEGAAAYRQHRVLERDPELSKRAKAKRLAEVGKLCCEVCDFNFAQVFGQLGEGFIEAHHVKPVSTMDGQTPTKLSDLALVCSNCHRMLHRAKPLLHPDQLRSLLRTADA